MAIDDPLVGRVYLVLRRMRAKDARLRKVHVTEAMEDCRTLDRKIREILRTNSLLMKRCGELEKRVGELEEDQAVRACNEVIDGAKKHMKHVKVNRELIRRNLEKAKEEGYVEGLAAGFKECSELIRRNHGTAKG